ncbi:hypothetical protein TSUD_232460 [Trifolium subterraneum]|uniref:Retrotransposon gag domain-containing protein n=1 Tax=Trifolium subterraneum TaxID=3900 RepID=A0A2Z6LJ19_TRISU|nr:hypothetical protein TSUD_232460 [Trifolium subterraneum]
MTLVILHFLSPSPLPNGFKLPRIELYNGSTDPDDHLRAFYVHMTLYAVSDAIFCKAFPCTLTGPALRDDESLKDYVSRFDKEAEKEVELSSRIYPHLMIAGLKPGGRFKESLVKEPVIDLEDLWRRASRFVDDDDHHDHNTQPPLQYCNKRQRDSTSDGV